MGCVREGVEDRIELQNIDPLSIGHNCVSFPFSWAAQPGTWGPSFSGTCNFSPTGLISKLSIGGSEAPFAGCWLSLPHLVSNWSGLQTNLLPVFTEFNAPIHGQGYNSDILRPDAPVIYISAFPILTARPGRRSIYNKKSHEDLKRLTVTQTPEENYQQRKFQFDHTNKWYMHNPAPVLENESHKLLWDFNIQTDHLIPARRPNLIIINIKKDNLQNCRLCSPGGPQNKSEGK